MNYKAKIKEAEVRERRKLDATKAVDWRHRAVAVGLALFVSVGVLIYSALADVPQPVLSITSLASNQFNIVITNAATTTNYTLFWTPLLADPNYPWQVLVVGDVGETNFTVDGGTWPSLYFRMLVGADSDGDLIPDWQDAQPLNPSVGILSLTIDSPTDGAVLQ